MHMIYKTLIESGDKRRRCCSREKSSCDDDDDCDSISRRGYSTESASSNPDSMNNSNKDRVQNKP